MKIFTSIRKVREFCELGSFYDIMKYYNLFDRIQPIFVLSAEHVKESIQVRMVVRLQPSERACRVDGYSVTCSIIKSAVEAFRQVRPQAIEALAGRSGISVNYRL